jgi:hypothetical protein
MMLVFCYEVINPRQNSLDVIIELKFQICGSFIKRVCDEPAALDGGLVFRWEV